MLILVGRTEVTEDSLEKETHWSPSQIQKGGHHKQPGTGMAEHRIFRLITDLKTLKLPSAREVWPSPPEVHQVFPRPLPWFVESPAWGGGAQQERARWEAVPMRSMKLLKDWLLMLVSVSFMASAKSARSARCCQRSLSDFSSCTREWLWAPGPAGRLQLAYKHHPRHVFLRSSIKWRWLLVKSLQITNAREDVQRREPSYTVGRNVNWFSYHGEPYRGASKRVTIWSCSPGYISGENF